MSEEVWPGVFMPRAQQQIRRTAVEATQLVLHADCWLAYRRLESRAKEAETALRNIAAATPDEAKATAATFIAEMDARREALRRAANEALDRHFAEASAENGRYQKAP